VTAWLNFNFVTLQIQDHFVPKRALWDVTVFLNQNSFHLFQNDTVTWLRNIVANPLAGLRVFKGKNGLIVGGYHLN
jgi:hypothetical protein